MAAASKGKICEEETESEEKAAAERMEDSRLSDLPEELKLHILGCLDTNHAVQTMILSRSWVSLWTRIPVLQFNPYSFPSPNRRGFFRYLVKNVLSRRDPLANLDTLKFNYINTDDDWWGAWCSAKILKHVFYYAFSHSVKHLEASVDRVEATASWPVSLCDSLMSLKLQKQFKRMRCRFLGPRSVLFKNLTLLYLKGAEITDVEPFSGFPVLESLTLIYCRLLIYKKGNESETLKLHALRLSDLTISTCDGVGYWELRTPRLRFFKYRGFGFLKHEGLPVLETLSIDFKYLMSCLFSTIPSIKSLTLFSYTVILLSSFPDELATRGSPFPELKDLIFRCRYESAVKAYLLRNSPHATIT